MQIAIALFVVGFPAWVYCRITAARKDAARYNDPEFQMVFRWLLLRYSGDPRHCRFELYVLVRKAAVSAVQLLTTKYPGVGVGASFAVVACSLGVTAARKPYRCAACMRSSNP